MMSSLDGRIVGARGLRGGEALPAVRQQQLRRA
jgi:hypothetical protein